MAGAVFTNHIGHRDDTGDDRRYALFVGVRSPVGETTLATFVNDPLAGSDVTVTVTFVTWLLISMPMLQVTTPAVIRHAAAGAHEGDVRRQRRPFNTHAALALDGPKFVTLMV